MTPLFAVMRWPFGAPRTNIKDIEQSFAYIEELVETTLEKAIDRDESGDETKPGAYEKINADQFLSSIENMFREDAKQQSVDLTVSPSSLDFYAPPFAVLRMMANFASNAIRYAPGSRVLIGVRRAGDDILLEVHDKGPGMSKEELSRVKQRSARGDASGAGDGGVGAGLSIVEKLGAEHNIQWTLKSRKGYGASASIRVPRVIKG